MVEAHAIQEQKQELSNIRFDDIVIIIKGWLYYLLRRWWIILLVCLMAGLAGVWYAQHQKPRYESNLTFALEDGGGGLDGALSIAAEFGINLGGSGKDIFAGDNIISIMSSRHNIEQVLLSLDTLNGHIRTMAGYYQDIYRLPTDEMITPASKVKFLPNQPKEKFSYLQDSVLFNLYEAAKKQLVIAKPDKKLNLYQVSFTSIDERFTKIFTERVVEAAIEFYTQLRLKRSKDALDVLAKRASLVKGRANSAISSRAEERDININPVMARQEAILQQKQLDISANTGAYTELFKNLEMANYQYLKDVPLLEIIDAPRYPMKKIKKGRLITGITWSVAALFLVCLILLFFKKRQPGAVK